MTCGVAGCGREIFSRGWCQKHYARWLRHGDPLQTATPGRDTGVRDRGGEYLYIKSPGHPLADARGWVAEHRLVAWEAGLFDDPSLDIHHRNGNKTDNRLSNLEPLSPAEHARRHAEESRKTHCVHGHAMTEENTHIRKQGFRECRTCMRERTRRYRARQNT